MKYSFYYKSIFLILFFFNIKNLITIESAALNMGLAECIGVYKQLKTKNLLDSESSNILQLVKSRIENTIDLEISESVKNALDAPEPPTNELTKYIWAED